MEIISFTGKSGTGKSFQATRVCHEYNIDAIIDDGLLIYHNRIVAGSSAKRCASKAAAMRTTLFNYDDIREDVMLKLRILKPDKLLILGTSDHMVDWITDALELPRASKRLYIEDFTTEEQRKEAEHSRNDLGEHVIPAPMAQIKRDFAGYFMHPARFIRGLAMGGEDEEEEERTVVRPYFSYYGRFEINESVIGDIVRITAESYDDCLKVTDFFHNGNTAGLIVVVSVRARYRKNLTDRCLEFQWKVKRMIEKMTAFSVNRVDIEIHDMAMNSREWEKEDFSLAAAIKSKRKRRNGTRLGGENAAR